MLLYFLSMLGRNYTSSSLHMAPATAVQNACEHIGKHTHTAPSVAFFTETANGYGRKASRLRFLGSRALPRRSKLHHLGRRNAVAHRYNWRSICPAYLIVRDSLLARFYVLRTRGRKWIHHLLHSHRDSGLVFRFDSMYRLQKE